ncbi:hypothetical protein [Rufibacter latericius]|uniref:DUF4178 domain-containing protein n=1 Tax=Rufibacter latericius TaxID=2487040 RepID=A0A3M9MAJ9_9BACT|nr:hypothetical protein [Rufibacter latericius]RNI22564.1 hypothetical protein EFB08_20925 [Rufibacter latericius]
MSQVCPACRAIVRKAAVEGAALQKALPMKEVLSILQVGSTGVFKEQAFEVIGRIQYFFTEGYRNHWFLLFKDGKTRWLGDWAGNYSLFQESSYTGLAPVFGLAIGENLRLMDIPLELETIDKVINIYWEGEVPEQGLQEQGFTSLELFRTDGQMGIVHAINSQTPHAYLGWYVDLNDLSLQGTRVHHEWL